MNNVLKEIFSTQTVTDEGNNIFPLQANTGEEQGIFLQEIIRSIKPRTTLEIGLAYGISSLFILETARDLGNANGSHIIIDPYPDIYWKNIGLLNIHKAGFDELVDFRKSLSHDALIELINEKKRIQFAYIDSTKVFDILLVDFSLIDKIMDIGGVIVFDDVCYPGIRRLMKLISKIPSYRFLDAHYREKETWEKRVVKKTASMVLQNFPFRKKIFPGLDFKTDNQNNVDFQCMAFQKISEDKRNLDWHTVF